MHTEDKYMINDQVCVGIPTYQPNIEKLIKTINSVIDQDYKNVSIIISENSPKNNEVKDLVESFKQKNIDIKYFGQENFLPQVENWDFVSMYLDLNIQQYLVMMIFCQSTISAHQ